MEETNQSDVEHSTQTDTVSAKPAAAPSYIGHGQKNVFLAAISYIGPLIIISYLLAKEDSFVMFHVRQAAVLFGIEIALWLLTSLFWPLWLLWLLWQLVNLGVTILALIGIVYAIQGKETALPLVGHLAVYIPR
ncbi:MAG: hypothetical protein ACYC1Y_01120 [Minisyncoccota bacterium]